MVFKKFLFFKYVNTGKASTFSVFDRYVYMRAGKVFMIFGVVFHAS